MIYAISALGIVAVIAVSMQYSSNASSQSVYTNEVLTQLVTIGRDIVDDIAAQDLPFDAKVDPDKLGPSATYPYVHDEYGLTPAADFGGCTDYSACDDIDDYHMWDDDDPIEGTRNGLDYMARITVRYVNMDSVNAAPSHPSGRSFAKEIVVEVSTNAIQVDDEPISASYNRVITYPRITNYSY